MKNIRNIQIIKFVFISFLGILMMPLYVSAINFDYLHYAKLLNRYVHEGRTIKNIKLNAVDYQGILKESRESQSDYSKFLEQLSKFNPDSLSTRDEQIAFWINAYNIGAIKMIIDHYPVNSIKSLKINIFKNPWNKKILNIYSRLYSLGEIEHEILLGRHKEKMAHFVVVCASLSCPDIIREVYRGETLRSQLERQARLFINNQTKGLVIDRQNSRVYISRIFKWDKKNFQRGSGEIIQFILPFVENNDDRKYLRDKNYKFDFLDYDWGLNRLNSVTE